MENLKYNGQEYRIKKMNAIEVLSFQSQISFDNYDKVFKLYNLILEKVEVKADEDKYLQVKQGNNFYPSGIENDIVAISKIAEYFLNYLKEVFHKSNI